MSHTSMSLFCLCLLVVVAKMSTDTATRADDVDVQSLLTRVQQQAATIEALQARVDALESKDQARDHTLSVVSSDLRNLSLRVGKQVAFSTHMSGHHIVVGNNSAFIFDSVVTSLGGRYNHNTGIFTSPYGGVYVFYFMMVNDNDAPTITAAIVKDGKVLGIGTSDAVGANNAYDDGSVLVTVHLRTGDQVYVKRHSQGDRIYGGTYCNFSGFLI